MSSERVRILNGNYSRYGVSVYDTLYTKGGCEDVGTETCNRGGSETLKQRYMSLVQSSSQWKLGKTRPRSGGQKVVGKAKVLLGKLNVEKKETETVQYADFNGLPDEVLCRIVDLVGDRDGQMKCLLVSRKWSECAKRILYRDVRFTSTYRVGQFVTTLRENPRYGKYVETLDLSGLRNGFIDNTPENSESTADPLAYGSELPEVAYAGWRDWRYRNNMLYGSELLSSINRTKTRRGSDVSSMNSSVFSHNSGKTRSSSVSSFASSASGSGLSSSNVISKFRRLFSSSKKPRACTDGEQSDASTNSAQPRVSPAKRSVYTNRFLLKYAHLRDVPLGYIVHLLDLCVNLQRLDLSNVMLSPDFAIELLERKKCQYTSFFPDDEDASAGSARTAALAPADGGLPPRFFSDSDKPYHFYQDTEYESVSWRLDPSRDKNMFSNRRPAQKRFKLRMLTNDDLCDAVLALPRLARLEIRNAVWLMQRDMRRLTLGTVARCVEKNVTWSAVLLNFEASGLQANSPHAGRGPLDAMLALLVLADLAHAPDDQLLDCFQLRWNPNHVPASDLTTTGGLATAENHLQYCTSRDTPSSTAITVRQLRILASRSGDFACSVHGYPDSVVLRVQNGAPLNPTDAKLKQCTDALLQRTRDLRTTQLLQHAGENFHPL